MKNKSFILGFSYLITQFICILIKSYFKSALIYWLGLFFALLFLVSAVISSVFRNKRELSKYNFIPIILFSVSLCMIIYNFYYSKKVEPILCLDGCEIRVSGTVSELPYISNNKYYYEIKTDNIQDFDNNIYENTSVRVSANTDLDFKLYDKVEFSATVYLSNEYLQSQNIYLNGYIEEYYDFNIIGTKSKDLKYYIQNFKKYVINKLDNIYDDFSYLPIAIITGDRSRIPESILDNFKSAGIYHIMAVSGMHIGIFISIITIVLSVIIKRKKLLSFISIIFVLFYMAFVGFTPSVTRSGIMNIIILFGIIISKKADVINSLGIAVFIICLLNPFAVGDVGLLLSVGSTLGIILYCNKISIWITERLQKVININFILKKLISTICVSISVMVFTIPMMIYFFGEIAVYSIITNLLVINIVPVFMVFIILSIVGLDNIIVTSIVRYIGSFIEWSAKLISSIPYSTIKTNKKFVIMWLIITIFIILFISVVKDIFPYRKLVCILCFITLVISSVIYNIYNIDRIKITILNCGNGYSIVITKNNDCVILGCGGSDGNAYTLSNYLENNNIDNIDYLIIPKTNGEYSRYFKQLGSNFNISQLGVYNSESITSAYEEILSSYNIEYLEQYRNINIWDNIQIDFYKAKSQVWSRIIVCDYSLLICPSSSDFNLLPEIWIKNNICIMTDMTKNFNLSSCDMLILSCSDVGDINTTDLGIDIYSTAIDNNICLYIKNDRVSIGSEGKWQD